MAVVATHIERERERERELRLSILLWLLASEIFMHAMWEVVNKSIPTCYEAGGTCIVPGACVVPYSEMELVYCWQHDQIKNNTGRNKDFGKPNKERQNTTSCYRI